MLFRIQEMLIALSQYQVHLRIASSRMHFTARYLRFHGEALIRKRVAAKIATRGTRALSPGRSALHQPLPSEKGCRPSPGVPRTGFPLLAAL